MRMTKSLALMAHKREGKRLLFNFICFGIFTKPLLILGCAESSVPYSKRAFICTDVPPRAMAV